MSELEKLTDIIITILGDNPEAKTQSESLLKDLQNTDLNKYVSTFADLLNTSTDKKVRVFCIVHLKKLLSDYSSESSEWHKLSNDTQKSLKEHLLAVLKKEEDDATKKELCEFIGELYATILNLTQDKKDLTGEEGKQWEDIGKAVWTPFACEDGIGWEASLQVLAVIAIYCSREVSKHQKEVLLIIKEGLEHENVKVKASIITIFSNYIGTAESKGCLAFRPLVPALLINIKTILCSNNEDIAEKILEELNDLLLSEPKIVKQQYKELIDLLKDVYGKKYKNDAIKTSILENMVVTFEVLPSKAQQLPVTVRDFFECAFTHIANNVEDPVKEWLSPADEAQEAQDEVSSDEKTVRFAMHLIDRVIYKLGETVALPIFQEMLVELVTMNNWKYTYAALMGLSQTGEYITNMNDFDHMTGFILKLLKDQQPKVRFAAYHCLGQFADDNAPDFQNRFADKVLPALIAGLSDPVPRVVSHCLAALTNFLDSCPKEGVAVYAVKILEPCSDFLTTSIPMVLKASVTAIATLARACPTEFVPYWEKISDVILTLFKTRNDKQIRGQCIECLTLAGESVGKEKFKKVAHEMMEEMIDIQKNHLDDVDVQRIYIISGWQRIGLILQSDFAPYIDQFMPSLLPLIEKMAEEQTKPKETNEKAEVIKALKGKDETDEDEESKPDALVSDVEEMTTALRMFILLVSDFKKEFLPYTERISSICVKLLQKSRSSKLRQGSVGVLPHLIKAVKESQDANKDEVVKKMVTSYIDMLWKSVNHESEPELRIYFMSAFRDILKETGRFMTEQEVTSFTQEVEKELKNVVNRIEDNQSLIDNEDDDLEDGEQEAIKEEIDHELEYQCGIGRLISTVFETHKELGLPLAQHLLSHILPSLAKFSSPKCLEFSLITANGMIEHLGFELVSDKWSTFRDAIINLVTHPNPDVRGTAAHGAGLFAEKTPEKDYEERAADFVKSLSAALRMFGPQSREFLRARDSIISAIGKTLKHRSQAISNVKDVYQIWFTSLPVRHDREKAREQHEILLDFLNDDPTMLLGEKNENLPHAVKIFALIVNTRFCNESTQDKIRKLIESLMAQDETKKLFEQSGTVLTHDLQQKLARFMTDKQSKFE